MRHCLLIAISLWTAIFTTTVFANDDINATVFSKPREVKPFRLLDNTGNDFTNSALKKHWTFLFFGFTNCGYVCPTTMAILNQVYQKLEQEHKSQEIKIVLVTIDPERDDVAKMNTYVHSFNKNFMGVTGNKKELDQLSQQLGILAMKIPGKTNPKKDYSINHTGAILLLDPEGELYASFGMPHNAEQIVHDFDMIEKKHEA